jgi:hypothetical protein
MGKFIISNLCDANYDNWNFFSNLENNKNVFKFFRENEVIIENTENCLLNDLLLNIQNLCRDNDISNQINNIFNIIRNILFDKYETMNENYPLHYLSLFIEKFLFIIKQIHKNNYEKYFNEYYHMIQNSNIKNILYIAWLVIPLIKNNYCNKIENFINNLLENIQLNFSFKESLIQIIEQNCKDKKLINEIRKTYAFILRGYALKQNSAIAKIHFLNLSIYYFKKVGMYKEIDINKIELSYININNELKSFEIKLPHKSIEYLNNEINKRCQSLKESDDIVKIFISVFNLDYGFTKDELSYKPSSLYSLFLTFAIHPGRKFIVDEEEKEKYWQYKLYEIFLQILHYPLLSSSLDCLNEMVYLNYWIEIISNEKNFIEKKRINLFYKIITYYLKGDFVAFMYSIIPQIEYIIKQVLLMNGINIKNKDEHQDETISLNAIIRNNNETLIKIYGEKFYSLLNFFFCDKFGFNIRNALLHGEEISLIQKNYSDWMLYIFFTMILYGDSKY